MYKCVQELRNPDCFELYLAIISNEEVVDSLILGNLHLYWFISHVSINWSFDQFTINVSQGEFAIDLKSYQFYVYLLSIFVQEL